ncbi:alpha/beta hydrolase [Bacillus sp. Marseille-P3661]|uniref:alpha/beta hydrolase n=1 Tax=Bacillus sp. Marseille-P3661 TaxID=1936234 RepID=UPI000C85D0E9|nr:alpha/beta hydrolase [Bacillus sp. Marseille-P3661]
MEKKINPELKEFFLKLPKTRTADEDIVERRRFLSMQYEKQKAVSNSKVLIKERYINVEKAETSIRIKIYEPAIKKDGTPGLLWIHGGGYIYGAPEMDDNLCQQFVEKANCLVVSVDYRLAPEHPYPAALEDCYAALEWLFSNAKELSVDVTRIAVAGASAGGGLTLALSLLNRERNQYPIIFQMPLYPMINNLHNTPSSFEITDKRIWNRELNERAWKFYLGDLTGEQVTQYAVPSSAEDLSGLPPTYTCIGTLDLFRDDTLDFVKKLSQAGVPTEFHLYPGCFHAFECMVPDAEVSQRAVDQYTDALKRAFQ